MTPSEQKSHARLFVRDDLPAPARGRRRAIVERLRDVGEDTAVDVAVERWPKRFERHDDGGTLRETYSSFADWARETDARLTPFFGVRECYSMETGQKGEWIVLPVACLAVYDDDDLVAVYPHCDGEEKRSVEDGLDALEREVDAETRLIAPQ